MKHAKLRSDYFLSLGGLLVTGDAFSVGENTYLVDKYNIENINSYSNASSSRYIDSFERRKNKNNQPTAGIPLLASWGEPDQEDLRLMIEWKPDIGLLIDKQIEHDAKQEALKIENVYTQEMHDAGELPYIGVDCEFKPKGSEKWYSGVVVHYGKVKVLITSTHETEGCFCNDGVNFRPVRTEADIAKEDQISDYMEKIENDSPACKGHGLLMFMQEQGMLAELK